MDEDKDEPQIETVLFDFGGVIAEEGFREGLKVIGRSAGLDEGLFFRQAEELIYSSGYVLGHVPESIYWQSLRETSGIEYSDEFLRNELMKRFIIRPWMIEMIKKIRSTYCPVGILSDQTDWLDKINEQEHIFRYFDFVLNSYYLGKGKRDETLFVDVANRLGLNPGNILFIDDNPAHCERAKRKRYQVIHYINQELFIREISRIIPSIETPPL